MYLDYKWYENIPKIELHVHLEGAIPYDAFWSLVQKYGGDPAVTNLKSLKEKFVFMDFPHFIETWVWKNSYIREYEDFVFIAKSVANDLAKQNICYAEIFISPPDFHRHGLETQKIIEEVRTGLSKVNEIEIGLVPDLVRDFGPKKAGVTFEEINEVKDQGIIGIGLGGSEQKFPPEPFAGIYTKAKQLGYRTTIHAGEAAGAESIWEAIHFLKPDRIGHGTRAFEDENLIVYLREKQIPIEMCPISNLKTGVVPSIHSHPIRDYFKQGLIVTVNTDDPKMFNNSLAEEYQTMVEELGFSKIDICSLITQSIKSSWLAEDRKAEMLVDFNNDPGWKDG